MKRASALCAALLCSVITNATAADPDRPLKGLFLGDRGHHQPAERATQLIPVLESRGIELRYTEDMDELNPTTLGAIDVLVIYANTTNIEPAQEKALREFVSNGGGFVPIHCASYCFLNSPAYVELVGAQFLRHGTGEFDTKVVAADHPIMKGLIPFRTWDETYVHARHNEQDRVVLQVRAEGANEEPWTWVRTQGKGRVFYTAYGHDERTWGHPGFHDLIERGIRWAANKGGVFDSRPRVAKDLKPFRYEESATGIPNYVAGAQWGTQGEPTRKMQLPVDAAESMKHMALPRDFEAVLFAAEPNIAKPIALGWDHRGRLWIAETTDYPNNLQAPGEGHDRIKICEDTNGDGRADKFTVFADGLSIPTSFVFANGGIIVHQVPNTVFLKDANGDDKADEKRVLFTGWGIGDTHAGPSNMRSGFDGWIYGINGYSGFDGTVNGERLRFGQGFHRFKPDGSKLEFLRSTNNNSWGVGLSEDGLLFGSTANGCPSVFLPIPNRYYERLRGSAPQVLRNIADSNRFFPATDKVRQVDWHGGFTAGAGHAIYTARTYPKVYWNKTAFVAEPTGHLVATFTLHPEGADFASHNSWNLFASDDEWTSPIAAEVGPDGHAWMIDWYNFIVQHNPTPQGFRTGKGNAYETPLRDKTHGRIYRLVYKNGKPSENPKLNPKSPQSLLAGLKSDNQLWRMHAQRLLVERGEKDVVPKLFEMITDQSVDEIGLNAAAVHAVWALRGLGELDAVDQPKQEAITRGLSHPSPGVRRNAALAAAGTAAGGLTLSMLKDETNPQALLAALLAVSEIPRGDENAETETGSRLADFVISGKANSDHVLADAATIAAARHDRGFLSALARRRFDPKGPSETVVQITRRVAEHYARGIPADSVGNVVGELADADPAIGAAVISGFVRGWPRDRRAKLGAAAEGVIKTLFARLPANARGDLITLANRWGSAGFDKLALEISAKFLEALKDENTSDSERVGAARQLIALRARDVEAARELLDIITPRTSPALATGLVEAIAQSESPDAGGVLADRLEALTPAVRAVALRVLLAKGDWSSSLLTSFEEGKVRLTELSLDQKQALAAHPDRKIAERAKKLLSTGGGLPDADRQRVIDSLASIVLKGGDGSKGKIVFEQQCAKCHTHAGRGGKVGPDLSGIAAHPREELLIHILDPSRSVEGNFVQYTVATTDGRVLNGLLASETKTSVELLDAEGKTTVVQRSDIDELVASKKSLMPEGFEKQVTAADLTDLLAFLTTRGKFLPLDLRPVATVVSTRGMFYDENAEMERLIFADWSPKTVEGVPFQLVDPQGSRVRNAILLYGPNGAIPPKMPKSVELPCHAPARAIHMLGGVSGWGFPYGEKGSVSLIVRLHYADGKVEDHPLKNGVELADYIRPVDVPGSKPAFQLRGRQLRYLAIAPKRSEPIDRIEFVKGPDDTAPVVMGVTVEVAGAE